MADTIGVAIAVHNGQERTCECLDALAACKRVELFIVVVDDGSTDGTWQMLQERYPQIKAIRGDGNLWWTGGNNRAIEVCLQADCAYVLMLNPDVVVGPDTIALLVNASKMKGGAITASLVVRYDDPNIVWWAGSKWGPLKPWLPIWDNHYLYKQGVQISSLPEKPYITSEAHGRGVLIPRCIFEKIGLYDEAHLPHYGADTDFSHRSRKAGYSIFVVPEARVRLDVDNTGLKPPSSFSESLLGYWNYLTKRKNGEALRVWWHLLKAHVPLFALVPSYLFILAHNSYRYWQRIFFVNKHHA